VPKAIELRNCGEDGLLSPALSSKRGEGEAGDVHRTDSANSMAVRGVPLRLPGLWGKLYRKPAPLSPKIGTNRHQSAPIGTNK